MSEAAGRPDVALVRPRDLGSVPPGAPVQDPLGVGYLAAALRKDGFEVVVLDAHALDLDDDALAAGLARLDPRVVGLSLHSFADYSHCAAISKAYRALGGRGLLVWGGEHATYHAERILRQHEEVDAVALGEGEATFVELTARAQGRTAGALAGAVTRAADGTPQHGGSRPAIADLDALPTPHKDIVEMALLAGKRVSLSVLSGRGCTHNCRFCTAHDFLRLGGGNVWRRRSPKAVADEVEDLARRYLHHPSVHPVIQFQDVIFLGTSRAARRWVSEYLDEIERRDLRAPFYCMARADAIIANETLLPRLVSAGLWSVEMGIESGVDRILQSYNKLNAAADNELAVTLLRRYGITFDASGFMMFDPRMTLDELRQNAHYLARFGAATWDFFVTRLQLYPGTALREEMIEKGSFVDVEDIGCTSGYRFDDPVVGLVAEHAFYYDLSIRRLDLSLRDAKAALALRKRSGEAGDDALEAAVTLVHETYCDQLLTLADEAEAGTLPARFPELVERFLARVRVLTGLLDDLLGEKKRHSRAA